MTPFQNLLHSSAEGFLVLFVNAICMCVPAYVHVFLVVTVPNMSFGSFLPVGQPELNLWLQNWVVWFHLLPPAFSPPFFALSVDYSTYATYLLLWLAFD